MNDKEKKIMRYREENKTVRYGQTVFTGSSLMEMFPINKLLKEHGDNSIIYNRGIGGFVSRELLGAIEARLPDTTVYLMAYYPVNPEAADDSMKECLKIRNNGKICLASEEVKKLARKHGQRFIDINKNLMDGQGRLKKEYTIEGLHINEDGYRAVYDDIMAYVKEPV